MYQYDDIFVTYYDLISRGVADDTAFFTEEAAKSGSPVLELACGTGRMLIPLAESGLTVTGLDISPAMLAVARDKVGKLDPEVRQRIEIYEGDMRDFSLDRKFKLIIIPYRSFLHILTVEDQRRALECVYNHLADDGRFIMNMFDPRLDIIAAHMGQLGSAVKKLQEVAHPDSGRRVILWDTRAYKPEEQIIDEEFIIEELEGGKVVSKVNIPLTLRWSYRYEMQHLFELCGFKVEALYGDFNRGPFKYGGEQIWVTSKA